MYCYVSGSSNNISSHLLKFKWFVRPVMVAFLHSTAVNLKYQFITKNNQKHLNYQSFDIIYSKNCQKINKPIKKTIKKQFSLS